MYIRINVGITQLNRVGREGGRTADKWWLNYLNIPFNLINIRLGWFGYKTCLESLLAIMFTIFISSWQNWIELIWILYLINTINCCPNWRRSKRFSFVRTQLLYHGLLNCYRWFDHVLLPAIVGKKREPRKTSLQSSEMR